MEEGLEATLEAANIAVERKNLRGEMIARGSCAAKFFYDMGDYKEAQSQCEHALGIAQKLSAHRFEPINQVILAKVLALHGDFEGALKMATEAVATSRETAFRYTGPMALGALCTVLDDPDKIYAAFSEAEETLKEECVGHNYIWFYRDAIEVCLRLQDWEKMEEYAQAAEEYTREEPLPWMEIIVARGRALSELYQNPRDPSSIEKVKKALMAEVAKLLKDGIDKAEIKRAKQRLLDEAVYARDSARAGARVLGSALAIGMTINDVETWPERISAVTVAEINAALVDVVNDRHSVTAILLPEKMAKKGAMK